MTRKRDVLCPSARPDSEGARVIGVVQEGSQGRRVRWTKTPVPISQDLLDAAAPASPMTVMRIAGACEENVCIHFDGKDCGLASKIARSLDPATDKPPPCKIRQDCRWYRQEGVAACYRCPQIITEDVSPDPRLAGSARPAPVGGSKR